MMEASNDPHQMTLIERPSVHPRAPQRGRKSDASSTLRVIEIRRRAVPAGTVGGRTPRTSNPRSRSAEAMSIVRRSSPMITGTMCVPLTETPHRIFASVIRMFHETCNTLASLRLILQDRQGFKCCDRHEWRRRRCEDEGAAAIDEKITEQSRGAHQGAGAPQCLAAGVHHEDVGESFERGRQSATVRSKNTRRMRLIDHQECLVSVGECLEFAQGRTIAIHAVKALDRDPDAAPTSLSTPGVDLMFDRVRVIMPGQAPWRRDRHEHPRAWTRERARRGRSRSPRWGSVENRAKFAKYPLPKKSVRSA